MEQFVSCGVPRGTEKVLTYTTIGKQNNAPNVLIVGNSYTIQLRDFFDKVAKAEGWCGILSGVSGTFPHHLEKQKPISREEFQKIYDNISLTGDWDKELNNLRSQRIISDLPKFKTIIISLNWWHPETYSKALPEVLSTIGFLHKQGKHIIVVNSCMSYNTARLAETYCSVRQKPVTLSALQSENYLRGTAYHLGENRVQATKQAINTRFPQVEWLDLVPFIPHSLLHNGKSILCNPTHINIYGANYLADRFIESGQHLIAPVPSSHSR